MLAPARTTRPVDCARPNRRRRRTTPKTGRRRPVARPTAPIDGRYAAISSPRRQSANRSPKPSDLLPNATIAPVYEKCGLREALGGGETIHTTGVVLQELLQGPRAKSEDADRQTIRGARESPLPARTTSTPPKYATIAAATVFGREPSMRSPRSAFATGWSCCLQTRTSGTWPRGRSSCSGPTLELARCGFPQPVTKERDP